MQTKTVLPLYQSRIIQAIVILPEYLILFICKLSVFSCFREIRLYLPFRTCIWHLQASSRSWHLTSKRFQLRFDKLEYLCLMSSAPEKLQNIHLNNLVLSLCSVFDCRRSFYICKLYSFVNVGIDFFVLLKSVDMDCHPCSHLIEEILN